MSFLELASKRYSVRNYTNRPVEENKILEVLEAARVAPSAVNYQPWHLIVVTEQGLKSKIAEAYPRDWFKQAPVVIVACGDHEKSWKRKDGKDHCDVDVAIALDHLALAATSLGLGTCWVCAFDAKRVHEILRLPEQLEVIALLPLGYPGDAPIPLKKRKDLDELVSWNGYHI